MNPRILPLVALCAAVATAVYFFLPSTTPGVGGAANSQQAESASGKAQPADRAGKNSAGGDSSSAAKRPSLDWKRFAAMAGGATDELHTKATPENVARFLAKHGETPANLVAVFESTKDRRLLDRALELFPNNPIVLMAAVNSIPSGTSPKPGETYVPDAQRMAYIGRFKAADPNNPLPWIFSAQELFKSGKTADAVADIRAALERPAFYTYANEGMDSTQQFLEDRGRSPVEASLLATVSQALPQMSAAMQASRSLSEWQKASIESGDTASVEEAIRLNYSLGRTFATPEASRTLIGQLVGIAMEKRALESLPADAQPDWLTVTPAQRLAEIEAQKQNVKALTSDGGFEWLIQSQDEQLLAEYLRRNRSDGEQSALTWLKTQKK